MTIKTDIADGHISTVHRILIVDDEVLFLKSIKRHFKHVFNCDYAESATEALEYLNSVDSYDVIVSDMNMPGMDGIELLEHCKLNYPNTLRILFTGNIDGDTVDRVNEFGEPYKILFKPCEMSELQAVLARALLRSEEIDK